MSAGMDQRDQWLIVSDSLSSNRRTSFRWPIDVDMVVRVARRTALGTSWKEQ